MAFEIDRDNLLNYFGYLAKASKKLEEKRVSRERLIEELVALKKLKLGVNVRLRLKELEKRIEQAIKKERQILTKQREEEGLQERIARRIAELEGKLTGYIEHRKQKEERFRQLEEKIKGRSLIIPALKKQIEAAETLYRQIRKSGKYPVKDIKRLELSLNRLREKLKRSRA